eukprot:756179-Hanusia_phi.AAC.3
MGHVHSHDAMRDQGKNRPSLICKVPVPVEANRLAATDNRLEDEVRTEQDKDITDQDEDITQIMRARGLLTQTSCSIEMKELSILEML